jgi:hypothetical protein
VNLYTQQDFSNNGSNALVYAAAQPQRILLERFFVSLVGAVAPTKDTKNLSYNSGSPQATG